MSMPDFAWPTTEPRPAVAPPAGDRRQAQFAADVRAGLSHRPQRTLPPQYFYDAVGSALFEAITQTPEYGLTRADERLLRRHAEAILALLPGPLLLAELGSGSARKTRWLLEVLARREPARYFPIDVSGAALARCRAEIGDVVKGVSIRGLETTYLEGLRQVAPPRRGAERLLVLFLGSSIGNFDRDAARDFLATVRAVLQPGDAMLLGADLEQRPSRLRPAYDDAAGVTAAFNLNLLARINRELGGRIQVRGFQHEARYDAAARRVEMHLRARRAERIEVPLAGVDDELSAGETIWTESSYKYDRDEVRALAAATGFACVAQWVDPDWPFAETLFVA